MQAVTETRAKPGKYLTFALGPEEFGLEILKVREIIGYMEITAVPQTPAYVRGVINLRGQVIPVVDLRTKFGMNTEQTTTETCIIVVETQQDQEKFSTGIVVDRMRDVLDITADQIEESVKNANNGVDIANEVGKVLDEILQSVGKTTDLVSEIAAASQEQAQGIDQVNTAIAQMDKVTQQNAANAEESASASEELSSQAESMNDIVAELVALAGGANSGTTSKTPRQRTKSRDLSHTDHIYHHIADATNKSRHSVTAKSSAEKMIPLGKDEELENFNS